jgi:hypothetical protein
MNKNDMSPRTVARITGALYLVTIVAGVFAQGFVSEQLVVSNDAAATAANIVAHQPLFRLGFTVYLIEMAAQIAMTTLFYELLRPVSKSVSLLSAIFGLVGCTIKTMSRLFYYTPLLVIGGSSYLNVFNGGQLNALSLLFLRVNDYGAAIALLFFGFGTLLKGYLVIRSTFLPRFLGVLSLLAGVGWLAFLSPPLGLRLFPFIAGVGLVGSLVTIGWLLVVGVDEQRWREKASVAAGSIW